MALWRAQGAQLPTQQDGTTNLTYFCLEAFRSLQVMGRTTDGRQGLSGPGETMSSGALNKGGLTAKFGTKL